MIRYPQHFHLQPDSELPAGVTVEELAEWSERSCGLACLRMVLGFHNFEVPPQWELVQHSKQIGAYGQRGISHAKVVELAELYGLTGIALPLPDIEAAARIGDAGFPTIVSVSHKLPSDGSRGGHLIVIKGFTADGMVAFADPSRWGADHDAFPAARFGSFSGRAMLLWPPQLELAARRAVDAES